MKFLEVRRKNYEYIYKITPYVFDEWKWWSYSKFKSILYIESGSVLLYLFLKTSVTANAITTVYAVTGILGGILLAVPCNAAIIAGIAIFYFRPILDWFDGLFATMKNQVSQTGAILDPYDSFVGWIALWAGFSMYVANKSGALFFYRLSPVIPAVFAADIFIFSKLQAADKNLAEIQSGASESDGGEAAYSRFTKLSRILKSIDRIFECRARTVDFMCLVILIEIFFKKVFISKWVYLIFLLWQVFLFFGKLYVVSSGKWMEREARRQSEK